MTRKYKILHILWSGGTGGAEAFARDIVLYSDKKRFEHIVCFLSEGGWVADEIAKSGVEVLVLGMGNGWSILGAWRLSRALERIRPDLIHNHALNYFSNIVLRMFSKVPRLYFEHGGEFLAPHPRKELLFYDLFGKYHDRILANSEYVRQRILALTKVDPRKVDVFYIGIDPTRHQGSRDPVLRRTLGIPEAHKVVGIVGRLVEMKGVDDFIRIVAKIDKQPKSYRISYVVVGGGELQESLEDFAKELGVDIRFLGDRPDVPALLRLFDVFLFTSKWEPFGVVILEAMVSGIPVVGFNTGGAAEIMARGGVIVIEERNIQKAVDAVVDFLEHPDQARLLGEAGRRNVEANFEIRSSVARIEEIYFRMGDGA